MQVETKKISLNDKSKFLKAKPIGEFCSILEDIIKVENILRISIKLKEFSGAWENNGVFAKDDGRYVFLTREYLDLDKGGRGNIILVNCLSPEDTIINNGFFYIIKYACGGGAAIYDEQMKGFFSYDILLESCGIPKIKKVN